MNYDELEEELIQLGGEHRKQVIINRIGRFLDEHRYIPESLPDDTWKAKRDEAFTTILSGGVYRGWKLVNTKMEKV